MTGLSWRRIGENDWSVDGVGRVYRYDHGPQAGRWFWTMTAHVGHDRTRAKCEGQADTAEVARAAVRAAWEATRIA